MAKYLDYTGLQYLWTKIKNYVSTQPLGANVRYDAQTLTTAQQEQARKNIAAANTNPNLLDNAYFVGGGSQLGDGVFPINQRGQTSYGASTRAFDRWITESGSSVTLSSNGATFSGSTVSLYDGAAAANLVGKTVTISAQLGDGTIISGTGVVNPLSQDTTIQAWLPTGGYVGFFIFANAQSYQFCRIYSGSATLIRAVKLELGTVSTLANDAPPVFSEELEKCYRRLWYPIFYANQVIAAGLAFGDSAIFDIVTPVEMAGLPQIALGGSWYVAQNGSLTAITGTPTATFKTANHLRVQVSLSSNIAAYTPVVLLAGEYQGDSFSAEL